MIALLSGIILTAIIAAVALVAVSTDLLQQRDEARENVRRLRSESAAEGQPVAAPLSRRGKGVRS